MLVSVAQRILSAWIRLRAALKFAHCCMSNCCFVNGALRFFFVGVVLACGGGEDGCLALDVGGCGGDVGDDADEGDDGDGEGERVE